MGNMKEFMSFKKEFWVFIKHNFPWNRYKNVLNNMTIALRLTKVFHNLYDNGSNRSFCWEGQNSGVQRYKFLHKVYEILNSTHLSTDGVMHLHL